MKAKALNEATLTHEDIHSFLVGFGGAVELDQMRVDAMPVERFHTFYDDKIWRTFRRDHLSFINQLLPTVDAMPGALLRELAWLAVTYETAAVREVILDLFVDAATGMCAAEEFETAEQFFSWLMKDMSRKPPRKDKSGDAKHLMMQWLPTADPLRIAEDPECGYGPPTGLLN